MDDADRATIRQQLPNLMRAVQLSPEFTSQLLRLRVFTHDGMEELEAEPLPSERRRRLLLEVTRRGPDAFKGLIQALLETGQLAAARILRPSLTLADLSPAAAAAISAAAAQPSQVGPHCVPTTPVHPPPPQPAPRPPAEPQQLAVDRTDAPGPELRLRRAENYLGNEEDSYRMMSRPRGLALVISNINFRTEIHEKRDGGEVDEVALPSLLRQLGFEVRIERDLDRSQLYNAIAAFAKDEAHAMYDMAILAVLTHGGQHVLYGVDSRPLEVEEVIRCFSNEVARRLAGKPKWLLFQACRGSEDNRAVRVMDPNRQATDGRAMVAQSAEDYHPMPEFGDIFLTFSSIPGYVSMRDLDLGTWLVQVLCEIFAEFAHSHSLQELHTKVHHRMNTMITSTNQKQTIEAAQRGWRKKLYFNPGL